MLMNDKAVADLLHLHFSQMDAHMLLKFHLHSELRQAVGSYHQCKQCESCLLRETYLKRVAECADESR